MFLTSATGDEIRILRSILLIATDGLITGLVYITDGVPSIAAFGGRVVVTNMAPLAIPPSTCRWEELALPEASTWKRIQTVKKMVLTLLLLLVLSRSIDSFV